MYVANYLLDLFYGKSEEIDFDIPQEKALTNIPNEVFLNALKFLDERNLKIAGVVNKKWAPLSNRVLKSIKLLKSQLIFNELIVNKNRVLNIDSFIEKYNNSNIKDLFIEIVKLKNIDKELEMDELINNHDVKLLKPEFKENLQQEQQSYINEIGNIINNLYDENRKSGLSEKQEQLLLYYFNVREYIAKNADIELDEKTKNQKIALEMREKN